MEIERFKILDTVFAPKYIDWAFETSETNPVFKSFSVT